MKIYVKILILKLKYEKDLTFNIIYHLKVAKFNKRPAALIRANTVIAITIVPTKKETVLQN